MAIGITELIERTNEVIRSLEPLQQQVVFSHFGLSGGEEKSLKEIAKELNTTESKVEQILASALRGLRHPSRSRRLGAFLQEKADLQNVESVFSGELEGFREKMSVIVESNFTHEEAVNYIANDVPELKPVIQELPKNQIELFVYIRFLILIFVLSNKGALQLPDVNLNIPVTINQATSRQVAEPAKESDKNITIIENHTTENHYTKQVTINKNETKIVAKPERKRGHGQRKVKSIEPAKEKTKPFAIDPCKNEEE